MVGYAVITRYDSKNKSVYLSILMKEPEFRIVGTLRVRFSDVASMVRSRGLTPFNFRLDSTGKLDSVCGSLDRLSRPGVGVVLAEVVTRRGARTGYKIITGTTIEVLRKHQIVDRAEQLHYPPLQNAIVRNGTVNCYADCSFIRIVSGGYTGLETKKSNLELYNKHAKKSEKSAKVSERRPIPANDASTNRETSIKLDSRPFSKPVSKQVSRPVKDTNTDLNDKQSRVLEAAKKRGSLVEYFSNPDLSVESMIYYADRVKTREMGESLKVLLDRPELPLSSVSELYMCINSDIDIDDLIDLSPEEIYIERNKRSELVWAPVLRDMWLEDLKNKAKFSEFILKSE